MKYRIMETKNFKVVSSQNYNYFFNKHNGYFSRWGKNINDDPQYAPSPEIVDMEVSTICTQGCPFCYKSNTVIGKNMTFETFKSIFHKLPRTVTQIAFGIGSINMNPDLKQIMTYCRENDYQEVIPNITINGYDMDSEWYDFLAKTCGALAVSHYNDNVCFEAVEQLTNRGMTQVNIHKLLSKDTYESCLNLLQKRKDDKRLSKLNAIVFLSLKQKGVRNYLEPLNDEERYNTLIKTALDNNIGIGFDSCGAHKFLSFIKKYTEYSNLGEMIEPCEAACMSSYINVEGKFFPCSFLEGEVNWKEGLNVVNCSDFVKDIWLNEKIKDFRKILLINRRNCFHFNI